MSKRENLQGDMTARHACALLILGWYLIVPPMVERDGGLRPNPRAPLTDWQHIDTYVSAEACRSGIVDHLRTRPAVRFELHLMSADVSGDSPVCSDAMRQASSLRARMPHRQSC